MKKIMKKLAEKRRLNSIRLTASGTALGTIVRTALRKLYRQLSLWFLVGLFIFMALSSLFSSPSLARSSQTRVPAQQSTLNPVLAFDTDSFQRGGVALEHLLQQGKQHFDNGQFLEAISSLQAAAAQLQGRKDQQQLLARIFMNLGIAELTSGQAEAALKDWRQATALYDKLNLREDANRARIYQTQALQMLGLNVRACETLLDAADLGRGYCQAIDKERLEDQVLPVVKQRLEPYRFLGLHSFGQILRSMGKLDEATIVSEAALKVAVSGRDRSLAQLSRGNTYRAMGNLERDRQSTATNYNDVPWHIKARNIPGEAKKHYKKASEAYNQAITTEAQPITKLQAQLNQLSLLLETFPSNNRTRDLNAAKSLWQQINLDLDQLPTSRDKIYAQINLAKSLASLKQHAVRQTNNTSKSISQKAPKHITQDIPDWDKVTTLLKNAVQEAKELKNSNTLSYALGNLGGLYEYFGWLAAQHQQPADAQAWRQRALETTKKALFVTKSNIASNLQKGNTKAAEAPHITYQWEWQLGRLLAVQQNREPEAISAFESAIKTLEAVRGDLLVINTDVQFSFRDNVEPLYRNVVDLLLRGNTENNLNKALDYIDALQLAELENFLSCDLSPVVQVNRDIDKLDPEAAFIYPIVLEDKLGVIFKLPTQKPELRSYSVQRTKVEKKLRTLRRALPRRNGGTITKTAGQVYEWLIAPFEKALEDNQVKTLVFVLDGDLRNIPMATLYDQHTDQYLVEKDYSLVLLPSSKLFDLQTDPERTGILGAAISDPIKIGDRSFSALKTTAELQQIKNMPESEILFNKQFTKENLQQKLERASFSTIHMATHGNFSSDPEETYVLAYEQLLKADDLKNLLQGRKFAAASPIDLLVLSACKTATGDNRATLGLAGLAVRSGTSSTLATLWQVSDDSTIALMKQFYEELKNPNITKAEALHRAQKTLSEKLEYQNPYYWAPYILVGSWK